MKLFEKNERFYKTIFYKKNSELEYQIEALKKFKLNILIMKLLLRN